MRKSAPLFCALLLSLSARRAWIEMLLPMYRPKSGMSLSARRAWIEICNILVLSPSGRVALRKESVDRNVWLAGLISFFAWSLSARRAWIEMHKYHTTDRVTASLSARRAWIEMTITICIVSKKYPVALRKESVDRNSGLMSVVRFAAVALRKESVDRNIHAASNNIKSH